LTEKGIYLIEEVNSLDDILEDVLESKWRDIKLDAKRIKS